jgi:hypothetical protein
MRGITAREASPDAGALRDFKDFFPNPKQPFKKGQVMMLFASKGLDAGIQMTVDVGQCAFVTTGWLTYRIMSTVNSEYEKADP